MKFSHALLFLVASLMIINANCSDRQVVFYDDFYLYSYAPVTYSMWYDLGCYSSWYSYVCYDPFPFYYWYRKDQSKFNEMKLRFDEKLKNKKGDIVSNLTSELKTIKKELYGDEAKSLSDLRQNAFTAESLSKQLQLNRLRDLEKFIAEKEKSSN